VQKEDNAKNTAKKKVYRVRKDKEVCSNSVEESDKNIQLI